MPLATPYLHACRQKEHHSNHAVDSAKPLQGYKGEADLQGGPVMMELGRKVGEVGGLRWGSIKKNTDLQSGRKGWSSFPVGDRLQSTFSQLSSQSRVTFELVSLSQPLLAPQLSCKSHDVQCALPAGIKGKRRGG